MSFEPLKPDDVITLDQANVMGGFPTTAQSHEIVEKIQERLLGHCKCKDDWFTKGVRCSMLRGTNGGWVEGRIRLQLQFDLEAPVVEAPAGEAPTD